MKSPSRLAPATVRIVVLDPIDPGALERLSEAHDVQLAYRTPQEEVPARVRDAHIVIVRSGAKLTADAIESAPGLRGIVRAGAGTDNIAVDAARRAGVTVCNVPGGSANAVAELALALCLAAARNIALADRQLRRDEWRKHDLAGVELTGKTMGVVGFGNIGSRIAELGKALGMSVLVGVGRPDETRRSQLAEEGYRLADLPELLDASDFFCLAVPLDDRTRGLIGAEELRAMRPTAFLVNVSRGGVVDEGALYAALSEGVISGAGVDVHAAEGVLSPLAGLDNVVLTPHIGAMSADAQRRIGERVTDAVEAILSGAPVMNRIC
ncbi:NAD(P)-dependent oxidoreductase [Streptomyces sp. NPDC096198]|uniref:NAD(P)-dependent oxidoreductase n=1 Tax=Streptomyces sp. NPDC096198 TaxID=3366080 RepID=UPI00380EB830